LFVAVEFGPFVDHAVAVRGGPGVRRSHGVLLGKA
jgi:epoxyqueuosine reductase QueG